MDEVGDYSINEKPTHRHHTNSNKIFQQFYHLVVHNKIYRCLWLSDLVSNFGDWFTFVATLSVLDNFSGKSGLALSWFLMARTIPPAVLGLLVGVIADSFDRTKALMIADIARVPLVLCFILVKGPGTLWLLYVVSILQFSFRAIVVPCRNGILPNIVKKDELVAANALISITWSTILTFGASLGGITVKLTGVIVNYAIDSVTFLISFILIWRVYVYTREPEPKRAELESFLQDYNEQEKELENPNGDHTTHQTKILEPSDTIQEKDSTEDQDSKLVSLANDSTLPTEEQDSEESVTSLNGDPVPIIKATFGMKALIDGFKFMWQNKYIFGMTFIKGSGSINWGAVNLVAYVKLIEDEFKINNSSSLTVGLLWGVVGAGTGIGPIVAQKLGASTLKRMHYTLVVYFGIRVLSIFLLAWSPNIFVLFASSFLEATSGATLSLFSSSILQMTVVNEYRGRVFAWDLVIVTIAAALSFWVSGFLLDHYHMTSREVLLIFAVIGTLSLVWAVVFLLKSNAEQICRRYKIFHYTPAAQLLEK